MEFKKILNLAKEKLDNINYKQILDKAKDWWILYVFGAITLVGFFFLFFIGEDNFISRLYASLDVASAVALATLAFYAYYEYSSENHKNKDYLQQLQKVQLLENKAAFLGIVFGGSNREADKQMRQFAEEKGIDKNLIFIKKFGDKQITVSEEDIPKLIKYLREEFMLNASSADELHVAISGVGITFFVCGDILSNWKRTIVYHFNQGKYEPWYLDNKHRRKNNSTLKDTV
ncbi:MAG: hypothetical protein CR967_05800 [Proteobacteria bacterium]|nr:MAG: hypothetical protein CR967_05800 [Pseudomonadota bacterium]